MSDCGKMSSAAQAELFTRVAEIERYSMGLSVLPLLSWLGIRDTSNGGVVTNPWKAGLTVAAIYVAVFIGLPYILYITSSGRLLRFDYGLYALQLYGALWAGWATVSTNIVARSLCWIVRTEIAPRLLAETNLAIALWIGENFKRRAVLRRSWSGGLLFSIIAGILIYRDLPNRTNVGEVIFWSTGWCLLFATSTGVVVVGQFYSAFAANLEREAASLYVIDPPRSSLLRSIDSLGQRMLLYWFLIAVSIAMIYIAKTWPGLGLASSRFVTVEVALAGFFSIGVGTWVFLGTQVAIRHAACSATEPLLRAIEAKTAAKLINQAELPDEEGWKEVARLDDWHARIVSTLSVRSSLLSVLSLVPPFIPLVSAILAHAFGSAAPVGGGR